jgi:hypothetical protein
MVRNTHPNLTTYFKSINPPYNILFSYRGPKASSRRIENLDETVAVLKNAFPSDEYNWILYNNSDPYTTWETQVEKVGNAHIVITNHGAFEGNMIYMRNGSLLIEIFGHYGNNEIHTFHRLALMFGVFYSRVHPMGLTDHMSPTFNLSRIDFDCIIDTVKDYFEKKPFRHNIENLSDQ